MADYPSLDERSTISHAPVSLQQSQTTMLSPFRIRNLFHRYQDWKDQSGIVIISTRGYDAFIQRSPSTRLKYIDVDDGETITVGSSLELSQRLLEPTDRKPSSSEILAGVSASVLHSFDICENHNLPTILWTRLCIPRVDSVQISTTTKVDPIFADLTSEDYDSLLAVMKSQAKELTLLRKLWSTHIYKPVNLNVARHQQSQQSQQSQHAYSRQISNLAAEQGQSSPKGSSVVQFQGPNSGQAAHNSGVFGYESRQDPDQTQVLHSDAEDRARGGASAEAADLVESPVTCRSVDNYLWPRIAAIATGASTTTAECGGAKLHAPIKQNMPTEEAAVHHSGNNKLMEELANTTTTEASRRVMGKSSLEARANAISAIEISSSQTQRSTPVDLSLLRETYPNSLLVVRCPNLASEPTSPDQPNVPKSLLDLEPEAEIARFPTISQFESDALRPSKGGVSIKQSRGNSLPLPARANTVTASNPAARLLKPFDPAAEILGDGVFESATPLRRATERCRRQARPEPVHGAEKTLWEGFTQVSPQAARDSDATQSTPGDPDFRPIASIARSQSLHYLRHRVRPDLNRLSTMRSTMDLSTAQRTDSELSRTDLQRQSRITSPTTATTATTTNTYSDRAERAQNRLRRRIHNCTDSLRHIPSLADVPLSRLSVYAEACEGHLSRTMAMANEDAKATADEERRALERRPPVQDCVTHLREMGFAPADYPDEMLFMIAVDVAADVDAAVDRLGRLN